MFGNQTAAAAAALPQNASILRDPFASDSRSAGRNGMPRRKKGPAPRPGDAGAGASLSFG
jgi:hypothetical protein